MVPCAVHLPAGQTLCCAELHVYIADFRPALQHGGTLQGHSAKRLCKDALSTAREAQLKMLMESSDLGALGPVKLGPNSST